MKSGIEILCKHIQIVKFVIIAAGMYTLNMLFALRLQTVWLSVFILNTMRSVRPGGDLVLEEPPTSLMLVTILSVSVA